MTLNARIGAASGIRRRFRIDARRIRRRHRMSFLSFQRQIGEGFRRVQAIELLIARRLKHCKFAERLRTLFQNTHLTPRVL